MGIPYTYRITHLPSGKHYYGARYAKDCHPSDLWVKYFTSSKVVKRLIEQEGKDAFFVEVRKVFKTPDQYVLGSGHVKFFFSRLGFIADRYESLCDEMRRRGYVCNQIPRSELLKDIDSRFVRAYNPDLAAIELNRARILERMPK